MTRFILFLFTTHALATGFEQNKGQTDPKVSYLARAHNQQVFLTAQGITLSGKKGAANLRFLGASQPRWTPASAQSDTISYYLGNDPAKWINAAPVFDRIQWRALYPGIDLVLYQNQDHLEYDLILAPNADPSKLKLAFDPNSKITANKDGSIEITTGQSKIRQRPPQIYQQLDTTHRAKIEGRFVLSAANTLILKLGNYNHSKPLTVDPVIEAATYIGGENDDEVVATTQTFIAGNTRSIAFPGALNALRPSRDIFLRSTNYRPPFNSPPSATFSGTFIFGGSGDDELTAMTPAGVGVALAGATNSTDFGPKGTTKFNGGASDGFVLFFYFDQKNQPRVGTTYYIGGSGQDRITSLAATDKLLAFAGSTDSPDLPANSALQPALAGGQDAFYGILPLASAKPTMSLSYLGGSARDDAYAVAFASPTSLWIGGGTQSPDFFSAQPGLNGPSDAFLTNVTLDPVTNIGLTAASYILGGSGDDSIRALASSPAPGLAFAGVTTSADLPIFNAAQSTPGGDRDAFAGLWDPAAGKPLWLTYLGGSGPDEALSLAQNSNGDVYLAGWTASTDLATVNPIQAKSGGGEDALVAFYTLQGVPLQISYFGGSGNERARHVSVAASLAARLSGFTDSADLPQVNPAQKSGGLRDGFVADIGTDSFTVPAPLIMAKDSAVTIAAQPTRSAPGLSITWKSSDPSRLRFNYNGRYLDQLTLLNGQSPVLEALAAEGQVDITVSAPGFLDRSFPVQLYPGGFFVSYPATVSTWINPSPVSLAYTAYDPATGKPLGTPLPVRSGLAPPAVNWSVVNPSLIGIAPIDNLRANLIALARGSTDLSVAVPGFTVLNPSATIAVQSVEIVPASKPFTIGQDLQKQLPISFQVAGATPLQVYSGYTGTLRARSADPSRLQLALPGDQFGHDSVQLSMAASASTNPVIMAQALASSGQVPVYLSSTEFDGETVILVNLEPSFLRLGFGSTPQQGTPTSQELSTTYSGLLAAGSIPLSARLQSQSDLLENGKPRLGLTAPVIHLTSYNKQIVTPNTVDLNLASFFSAINFEPKASGATDLQFSCDCGNVRLDPSTLHLELLPFPDVLPVTLNIGRNLQVPFNLSDYLDLGGVKVTSDDPTALLISSDPTVAGSATITAGYTAANQDNVVFYLQALKDSGETTATLKLPTGETTKLRVILRGTAVGFYFPGTYSNVVAVAAFAVDPDSGAPIVNQIPLPGKPISFRLRSADSPTPSNYILNASQPINSVILPANLAPQGLTLTVEADAPFTPSVLNSTVWIPPSSTVPSLITLSKDTMVTYNGGGYSRVTSSDPSRLLLSLQPTDPPTAALDLKSANTTFYLHALAASGSASLHLEATSLPPADYQVSFQPLVLNLSLPNIAGAASGDLQLTAPANTVMRPGSQTSTFGLAAVDPSALTLTPSSFQIGPGAFPRTLAKLSRLKSDATQIAVNSSSDVYLTPNPILIPDLTWTNQPPTPIQLGANMQRSITLDLRQNLLAASGSILTLTSSDPKILLLSRAATADGSNSISATVAAGQSQTQAFWLQGLATGTARILATMNGQQIPVAYVTVQPVWVGCTSPQPVVLTATASATINCGFASIASDFEFRGQTLRPNQPPVTVSLTASTQGIFSITPASLSFTNTAAIPVSLRSLAPGISTLKVGTAPGYSPPLDRSSTLDVKSQ